MIHTVAFHSSFTATTTVLTNLAGVADPTVRVSGNFIYTLPNLNNIGRVYGIGAGIVTAQLQAPSLRQFVNLDVGGLDSGTSPTFPVPVMDRYNAPVTVTVNEGISALTTINVPTGTRHNTVLVDFTDGALAPVAGQIFTVGFTLTAGSGDYAWNNAAITLSQTLPVGTYTCVGGRLEGAGLIAWRFYPVGSAVRPGFIGMAANNSYDIQTQRFGDRGALFDFDELTPPTVDTYGVGVSGTLQGYIDLVKKS